LRAGGKDGGDSASRHLGARRSAVRVALRTIDNSDGARPSPTAEVTITRTMFRKRGSEYASRRFVPVARHPELLSVRSRGVRSRHRRAGPLVRSLLLRQPEDRRGSSRAAGSSTSQAKGEGLASSGDAANLTRASDLANEPAARSSNPWVNKPKCPAGRRVTGRTAATRNWRLLADDSPRLRTSCTRESAGRAALGGQAQAEGAVAAALPGRPKLEGALASAVPAAAPPRTPWYRLGALQNGCG